MIRVYFEDGKGGYAEEVAVFYCSEAYDACAPALEALVAEKSYIVTESEED